MRIYRYYKFEYGLLVLKELVSDLHPNPRGAFNARMATEFFVKALLTEKAGYTDKQLKELGHDLFTLFEHADYSYLGPYTACSTFMPVS